MPAVQTILGAAAILVAGLAVRAHYLDASSRWQVYVFKPLATLLILALALSLAPASPHTNGRWPPACCFPPPAMSS